MTEESANIKISFPGNWKASKPKIFSKNGEKRRIGIEIKSDMKKRGEWGKFFPLSAAYAGYNYSLAHLMFPMTKEGAIAFSAKWEEPKTAEHLGVRADDLPDRIDEVKDEIIRELTSTRKKATRLFKKGAANAI